MWYGDNTYQSGPRKRRGNKNSIEKTNTNDFGTLLSGELVSFDLNNIQRCPEPLHLS